MDGGVDSDDEEIARGRNASAAAATEAYALPPREFAPARADVAELAALADCEKLAVVSYNVLSQMGARRLQRADRGYVDSVVLGIVRRRELLLRELLSYDADVLCLQEVDDVDDFWAPRLTASGYDSVSARHPSGTRDDGLLIAFRRDAFQLFRTQEIDLDAVASAVSDENLAAKCRQHCHALLVNLQPWEQSRLPSAVCIVTTQLAAGDGAALETVRVLQTEYLCRAIAQSNASFNLPIVLTGSFNALPSSDVYHVILTGRRRPVPQAPREMARPVPEDATPTSVRLTWERPACGDAPITGFKIAIKNCTSATLGFSMHEIELDDGDAGDALVTLLSAGIPYQFRVAARNAFGYGPFSQPSLPFVTPLSAKPSQHGINNDQDDDALQQPLYVVDEIPPLVKPYAPSFGSGRTPRFESGANHMQVSPRKLLQSHWSADAQKYATLAPRADRDDALVHGEQFESAYATYYKFMCEPEFTYSSEPFTGTIDYIFYSSTQFAPFQLLALPTLDELERLGVDKRQPDEMQDKEWAKHKPSDWKDSIGLTRNDDRVYMGEWVTPSLPNAFLRASAWLPNKLYPSDHLALACVLAMKKEDLAVEWN